MSNTAAPALPDTAEAFNLMHEGIFKQAFAEKLASCGYPLQAHELDSAIELGVEIMNKEAQLAKSQAGRNGSFVQHALNRLRGNEKSAAARQPAALSQADMQKFAEAARDLAGDERVYNAVVALRLAEMQAA